MRVNLVTRKTDLLNVRTLQIENRINFLKSCIIRSFFRPERKIFHCELFYRKNQSKYSFQLRARRLICFMQIRLLYSIQSSYSQVLKESTCTFINFQDFSNSYTFIILIIRTTTALPARQIFFWNLPLLHVLSTCTLLKHLRVVILDILFDM